MAATQLPGLKSGAALPVACGVEGCPESGSARMGSDPRPGAPTGFVMLWPPPGWIFGPADYSNPGMAIVPYCPNHRVKQESILFGLMRCPDCHHVIHLGSDDADLCEEDMGLDPVDGGVIVCGCRTNPPPGAKVKCSKRDSFDELMAAGG